jgi:hypothetical protein
VALADVVIVKGRDADGGISVFVPADAVAEFLSTVEGVG